MKHLFTYFNEVFPRYWDKPAMTEFNGTESLTYGQLATRIARLHVLFELLGIKEGDKIALCGRNSINWAVAYLAVATYKAVIVSILQDFTPDDVKGLVRHSDAKMLIVGPYVWKGLKDRFPDEENTNLLTILSLTDFSILHTKDENAQNQHEKWDETFKQKYPDGLSKKELHYDDSDLDNLLLINYTSGSMGQPKGVMLTTRSISSNVRHAFHALRNKPGWEMVSMLPLAHAYGQLSDFLYQVASGCHVYYLTKTPTPTLLLQAFKKVHPYMIITVPLVIEKIYKTSIRPIVSKKALKMVWNMPLIGKIFRSQVRKKLLEAFGGNIKYFLVGGAALNEDVQKCLMDIKFPLTIGYGLTECGPLVSGSDWEVFRYRSCGEILPDMEVKIEPVSDDDTITIGKDTYTLGEILVKGPNVMQGYYKNDDATRAAFTEDGWLRTGDLGYLDKDNFIYIRGRNKNMLLGASGQNIYPEEIEEKLNNMQGVAESIVVEREGKLIGLVFPDGNFDTEDKSIIDVMKENLQKLNSLIPNYSKVSNIEIVDKEFEKTPKKSIKRFLYK